MGCHCSSGTVYRERAAVATASRDKDGVEKVARTLNADTGLGLRRAPDNAGDVAGYQMTAKATPH